MTIHLLKYDHYLCNRFCFDNKSFRITNLQPMKFSRFLIIPLFGAFILVIACNTKKDDATTEEDQNIITPASTMMQDPSDMPSTFPSTSPTNGVSHYKCNTAGCTGGADGQGKCPVCGADLVHNPAFHNQGAEATGTTPADPISVTPSSGGNTVMPNPPSAQNAQGVYHYTCPKGCSGGAASAGNCATCGGALTHNQAYHNN
jgi:hypothetical protein